MNPQELKSIQKATGQIESALEAIEAFLEDANNRHLFLMSGQLVQALRHAYECDPALLGQENRERIETLLAGLKPKSGRNDFTTGF